ncbi:MAG: hypothetical protein HY330_05275, partial [Chloroflexi bacterium]|nr:hypothetical protein [Chloroflexota bacterium]
ELAITAASFGGFALVFTLFTKLFPIISVWEMEEGWEKERAAIVSAPAAGGLVAKPALLSPESGGTGHD